MRLQRKIGLASCPPDAAEVFNNSNAIHIRNHAYVRVVLLGELLLDFPWIQSIFYRVVHSASQWLKGQYYFSIRCHLLKAITDKSGTVYSVDSISLNNGRLLT